jgi:hypothetical protein
MIASPSGDGTKTRLRLPACSVTNEVNGCREAAEEGRLLREPSGLQPLPQGARASDRIGLPQRLLGFDGRHSARARSLGLILCGSELGLSVCELGGQLIDAFPQLLSLSMTGSEGLIGEVSARLGHGRAAVGLFKLLA